MKEINIVNINKERVCYNCGSNKTTLRNKVYERWYNIDKGTLCHKCYQKLKGYPRYNNPNNKEFNNKHNPNKLWFRNKTILLYWNPRTGYCSQCTNNIYDGSCNRTHMHHSLGYYIIFPWYGIIELCASCHRKQEGRY